MKKSFDDTGNLTEVLFEKQEVELLKVLLSQLTFNAVEDKSIQQAQIAKAVFDKLV